jgi:hypothetical protein
MMMRTSQINRAHNFFTKLLRTEKSILDEKGITRCDSCDGTGLDGIVKMNDGSGYSWPNINSFCDECHGVGFRGLRNLKTFDDKTYICGTCEGVGCDECHQTGYVDWITHAMGR